MFGRNILFDAFSMISGKTEQMKPIGGRENDMIANKAGGFTFEVSLHDRILRTVILGTDKNTYYSDAKELTIEALNFVNEQIGNNKGQEILSIVRDVYLNGRAPKIHYCITIHAYLCRSSDIDLRRAALEFLKEYRTISHLYTFLRAYKAAGTTKGFGRMPKRIFSEKIKTTPVMDLAYQITKYQQRDGWSFSDILSLTHVCTGTGEDRKCKIKDENDAKKGGESATEIDLVLRYSIDGWDSCQKLAQVSNNEDKPVFRYLSAINEVKTLDSSNDEHIQRLCQLIRTHRLTREQLPTQFLKNVVVLRSMLYNDGRITMPMTALIRNLGNLTANGVFSGDDGITYTNAVVKHLTDQTILHKAHVHPVQALIAYLTYEKGQGEKGLTTWTPVQEIVNALDKSFYLSFKTIKPTGKRILVAIDCSGSMTSQIPSCPLLSSAQAAAVMAMTFARAEMNTDNINFVLFTSENGGSYYSGNTGLYPVTITPSMNLGEVNKIVQRSDFGTTDCALPITNALKTGALYDAFVVITDNETYMGKIHPSEAIEKYRKTLQIPAKMVVIATLTGANTISDPKDAGMMDISGFDTIGPQLVTDFIRGESQSVVSSSDDE